MIRSSLYLCTITALLLLIACGPATGPEATIEEESGPPIKGVWTFEETEVIGGPEAGTRVSQATLVIFTDAYYSSVRDTAVEPRPLWKSDSPSNEEILTASNGFGADSGTYEFDGSTLVIHPSVANMPNIMAGGSVRFDCQLEGDILTLIWKPGYSVIPGTELTPSDLTEERIKLRRLE
jgi:hypothetical protein